MQRILDHAGFFLAASGLVGVFAVAATALALGFDPRSTALAALPFVGLVHGLLLYAVRRLQRRAAYEPPLLWRLEATGEAW